VIGIDPVAGLKLKATSEVVTIATPPFRCGTIVAPFARVEWAARGLKAESQAGIEWLLEDEPTWPEGRVVAFPAPNEMQYANVPLYRYPGHAGLLTRYRLRLDHAAGAEINLKSIITAIDTRHPITNALFLRGCSDYFAWTRDVEFLRQNMGRMRKALHFALKEFRVREEKHVFVPWVGHDGRSGLVIEPDGKRPFVPVSAWETTTTTSCPSALTTRWPRPICTMRCERCQRSKRASKPTPNGRSRAMARRLTRRTSPRSPMRCGQIFKTLLECRNGSLQRLDRYHGPRLRLRFHLREP
jgi:hypothetical protein